MTHAYSDPTRENDPYALPDVEIYYLSNTAAASLIEIMFRVLCVSIAGAFLYAIFL
jgi:hypothetical protein